MMLYAFLLSEDAVNPAELNEGSVSAAKRVLDITENEIDALADELSEMCPPGYAIYYKECIYAMQEKLKHL